MNILSRVGALEVKLLPKKKDTGYKIVLLQEGETRGQAIVRSGITAWPADRIISVRFVSADRGERYSCV